MSHKLVSLYIGEGEYYTRTDADAVIAELEKRIDLLKDKANYNEYAYKRKSEELADTCRFYEDELWKYGKTSLMTAMYGAVIATRNYARSRSDE